MCIPSRDARPLFASGFQVGTELCSEQFKLLLYFLLEHSHTNWEIPIWGRRWWRMKPNLWRWQVRGHDSQSRNVSLHSLSVTGSRTMAPLEVTGCLWVWAEPPTSNTCFTFQKVFSYDDSADLAVTHVSPQHRCQTFNFLWYENLHAPNITSNKWKMSTDFLWIHTTSSDDTFMRESMKIYNSWDLFVFFFLLEN